MKTLYITGFMGSGKTTVGQLLGEKWNLPVVDTDRYIEEQVRKSVRDIFESEGEPQFRAYETHYLKLIPTENTIVTTGGGIILKKENRDWMKENGVVIHLHCDTEVVLERLENDTTRPLLDGDKKANIDRIYNERMDYYLNAHYTIDTTHKAPKKIIEEIEELFKSFTEGNTSH